MDRNDTEEEADYKAERTAFNALKSHEQSGLIAQKRVELAETIRELNDQLRSLAFIDLPIKLTTGHTGITRLLDNKEEATPRLSSVPSYMQISEITDVAHFVQD
jgi:hypothetical protein